MNCLVIVGLFLLAMIIFEALLLINKDEECNECDYKKQVKELVKKEKKQRKEEEQ